MNRELQRPTTKIGILKLFYTFCDVLQFFPSILAFGLLWFIGGLLLKACAMQNYFKYHSGDSVSTTIGSLLYVLVQFLISVL